MSVAETFSEVFYLILNWRRSIFAPAVAGTALRAFRVAGAVGDAQRLLGTALIDTVSISMTLVNTLKYKYKPYSNSILRNINVQQSFH